MADKAFDANWLLQEPSTHDSALALFRVRPLLVVAVFIGWVAKELLGDIPDAGGAWLVMADSVADLCFGALGYIIAIYQMEKYRHDQS